MSTAPLAPLTLRFTNLPLAEVALRGTFAQPIPLTFDAVNSVADQLHDEFPAVTEPQKLEAVPGRAQQVTFSPAHIAGVVYSGNKQGLHVMLQSQVAVVRWLKEAGSNPPEYPRYGALKEAFRRAVAAFRKATHAEQIPITVTNMSYVNLIRVAEGVNVLEHYFSNEARIETTKGARRINAVEVSWQEKDRIDLRYKVERAKPRQDDGSGGATYSLTTIAGTNVSPQATAEDALDGVHNRLQHFFRSLISQDAKDEWGYDEEAT